MADTELKDPLQEDQSGTSVHQTATPVQNKPRSRVNTKPDGLMMNENVQLIDGIDAKVSWIAKDNNVDGKDDTYKLSWWTNEKDTKFKETKATEYTLTKLKPGEKYFVNVVVKVGDKESAPSEAIDFYTAPLPPSGITVDNHEASPHDSLFVRFKNANKRPMAHRVTAQPIYSAPEERDPEERVPKGKNFALIRNLVPGQYYSVQVVAVDERNGIESEPTTFATMKQTYHDAPIPTSLDLDEENGLKLTWEKSEIKPLHYKVYYRVNGGKINSAETNETSFVIDNVKPSTNYKFCVTAVNGAGGESEKSREKGFKTAPAPVSNLHVKSNPDEPKRSFLVSYDYPKQQGIKYRVVAESMDGKEVAKEETSDSHVALNGLAPGRPYYIYVVTICGDKKSDRVYFHNT